MSYFKKIKKRYQNEGILGGTVYYIKLCISAIKRTNILLTDLIIIIEKKLPIKNSIVFECESDMDDNPRALYEYLLKIRFNKKHKLIWIVNDTEVCRELYSEKNVKFINRKDMRRSNQIRLNYYLGTSKYFVFSHPYWFKKCRKEQIVFNIDHGLPMKNARSEREYEIAKCFDYIICPSEFMVPIFLKRYRCQKNQLVRFGYPRCDYLYDNDPKVFSRFFKYSSKSKFIICMPTFRQANNAVDANNEDPYCLGVITNEETMREFNLLLENLNIHIVVKPHPLQRIDKVNTVEYSNIHYLFNKDLFIKKTILYQLLGSSDALISDLSSVCYDYSIIGKPMAHFMNNIQSYDRGCIWNNIDEFIHGYRIITYNDLVSFVKCVKIGMDEFRDSRKDFSNRVWENNVRDSSKQIAEWLLKQ